MTDLSALWLPILLSAVFVFVMSSIIHMALPWHKNDYRRIPGEDKLMDALRPLEIPPGDYMVPRPMSMAEMKGPEFAEKVKKGPVLVMTVMPNQMIGMGKNMLLWFIYSALVSLFAAYIAGRALPPGADHMRVLQFAGATAFIGFSMALWQMSIWYRRAWSTTFKSNIDGLIYGLITGGTFAWLWPR